MSKIPFDKNPPMDLRTTKADIEINKDDIEKNTNAIISPNPLYVNPDLNVKTFYNKPDTTIATQDLYSDDKFHLIYESSTQSLKWKHKLTGANYICWSNLAPHDDNNDEGSPTSLRAYNSATSNQTYYFGPQGGYDTDFRLENYGSRNTIHVTPLYSWVDMPSYVIDAFVGSSANLIVKIEVINTF